ncbi:PAS domain-containing protein [Nisaea nitritireducens]|uniref:hypothetical protein n=1 Tax=Nisaea nitritireducens TaxID=568392 RepID=UPI001868997C|nr:hypothetical protein [Nisaea nitritireducens]
MAHESTQLLVNRDSISRLYNVWSTLPDGKPRNLLDPLQFGPRLLPHLALLKAIPDDYRYELVGERIGELSRSLKPGSTAGGQHKPAACRSNMFRLMRSVAESRKPAAQTAAFEGNSGIPRRCFSMVLPLSMDGMAVNDLLLGLWPVPSPAGSSLSILIEPVLSVSELVEELDLPHSA